jgi:hypothetical protein
MATVADVSNILNEVNAASTAILNTLSAVNPSIAVPAAIAEEILSLATKALAAYAASSGKPITVESVQALLLPPTLPTEPAGL